MVVSAKIKSGMKLKLADDVEGLVSNLVSNPRARVLNLNFYGGSFRTAAPSLPGKRQRRRQHIQ